MGQAWRARDTIDAAAVMPLPILRLLGPSRSRPNFNHSRTFPLWFKRAARFEKGGGTAKLKDWESGQRGFGYLS